MAPPLDPQVAAVLAKIRLAGNPEYWQMTPAQARDWHNRKAGILDIAPEDVHAVEDRVVRAIEADVPVRIYTPRASQSPLPVLVWLHGGGHVVGSLQSYDALCRKLALSGECIVVSVDYRLAPEHKFPAGVVDSFAALKWTGRHAHEFGGDAARIAIGGDSAGGNLAAVVAIAARDDGDLALRFQLLIYPATDQRRGAPSHASNGQGYLLTRDSIAYYHDHYIDDPKHDLDWRASPLLHADLANLPPALVLTAGYDPLRDEGLQYAEALTGAGNRASYVCFERQIHGFITMGRVIDEANVAVAMCAAELRRRLR